MPPATLASPTATAVPGDAISAGIYLDDRSGPAELIRSYYNAINRKEYVRAYSYWNPTAASSHLAPFPRFQQGYTDTRSVELGLGSIGTGVGAGQIYYFVPVSLAVDTVGGATQQFVGCYSLHMANPGISMVPPYRSLAIEDATIQTVSAGENLSDLLAHACDAKTGGRPMPVRPAPTFSPTDIGKDRYLDDRSGPVEVIRSYYNAINRHEYARAYSYWNAGAAASQLPPFSQFEQGYASTTGVALTTGRVTSDVGAGQIYYSVPISLVATAADGATQTFVGCYQLHLGRPGFQAAPPFQPLGIRNAAVQQVPNDADTAALLGQACH